MYYFTCNIFGNDNLFNMLNITHLHSGGIITNYFCTSKCRHCLYGCSPSWPKKYIDRRGAREIFSALPELGCLSVHIGGGEPFLNIEGLLAAVEAAANTGIHIEYIETNASWFKSEQQALPILEDLIDRGVSALLISISPFHNEHIPFKKTKGLIAACGKAGMNVFPWVQTYIPYLDRYDDEKCHSIDDKEDPSFFLRQVPSKYWMHFGGRAIYTYSSIIKGKSCKKIAGKSGPCRELADTGHFHIDFDGNYIPGLCSGLSIDYRDLGAPLSDEKYPLINMLYEEGVGALLERASKEHNFVPEDTYISKCHLCLDIRTHLSGLSIFSNELQPSEYYLHVR